MSELNSKPLLISIVGPTAVGKTSLSIELAKYFNTEIISADSRQMYQQIGIGTAKPSLEEQDGIKHHFVDCLTLDELYSAGQYETEALELINSKLSSKKVIIQTGGSGLYVKALLEGLDEVPRDLEIRNKLNQRFEKDGLDSLLKELQDLDSDCYDRIDQQNPQRVIRALEVCLASGRPYSSFLSARQVDRPFDSLLIGLKRSRENLNERIAHRCEIMLSDGWIEEAQSVIQKRSFNSLNTVGYKEIFRHLDGELNLQECKELIIRETQRFAKRQMTWFNKMNTIHWIDLENENPYNRAIELVKSSVHR